jgi:hypothetical protein
MLFPQQRQKCGLASAGDGPNERHHFSFDHLIGGRKQRGGHGEAQHLGRLDVDHKFILKRLLDGQVCGLFTPKNAIHISGRPTKQVGRGYERQRTPRIASNIDLQYKLLDLATRRAS